MKFFKNLWKKSDGNKYDTGVLITLAALVLQQYLGIDSDESTGLAEKLIVGAGSIIAAVGYIHRRIKARKASANQ